MKTVFVILAFLIAVLAAFPALKAILCPSGRGEGTFIVLPVAGHVEDIELRVRRAVCAAGRLRGAVITVADFGADSETAEIIRRLCREYDALEVIDGNDLVGRLTKRSGREE